MNKSKANAKKASKNLRNVLAQPLSVDWPRIPESELKQYSNLLREVERKYIVSGCNGVIRLLQNGQVSAFFMLTSFNPQVFGKLIIRMARKHDPAVLALAVPSFPLDYCAKSTFVAVTKPKENEPSKAVQALVSWMKDVSVRSGFITEKPTEKPKRKKTKLNVKKSNVNVPMTNEEVSKLNVFEPVTSGANRSFSVKRSAQDTEDFISFSTNDTNVNVAVDHKEHSAELPTKKFKPFKSTYIPLTVNRVRGNPNRVEHKKKKRPQ